MASSEGTPNPFQPPRDHDDFVPTQVVAGDRPLGGLATMVLVMLGLVVVVDLALLYNLVVEIRAFGELQAGRTIDVALIREQEQTMGLVVIASIAALLASAVVWSIWAYRAATNLRSLGLEMLEYTPGSMVWWWFVPFLNWVRPLQAITELWKGSAAAAQGRPGDWPSFEAPKYFVVWWGLWVARAIFGAISQQVGKSEDLSTLQIAFVLDLVGYVALIAAAPLAAKLVMEITRLQAQAVTRSAGR